MTDKITKKLRELLESTRKCIPEHEFCGLGIVIYSDIKGLPVLPLCPERKSRKGEGMVKQLAFASFYSNPCHDGFHLISDQLELTHTNQYFAPPLPNEKEMFEVGLMYRGARYMSAQIGSLISTVCCTGVFSDRDGLVIFEKGKEV